jgi:heme/copper-type cytochrome/quinol oxidase subunit 2
VLLLASSAARVIVASPRASCSSSTLNSALLFSLLLLQLLIDGISVLETFVSPLARLVDRFNLSLMAVEVLSVFLVVAFVLADVPVRFREVVHRNDAEIVSP